MEFGNSSTNTLSSTWIDKLKTLSNQIHHLTLKFPIKIENYSALRKNIFKNDVNTYVSINDLNKTDETERKAIYSHFVCEYDITEEDYIYIKITSYQPKCIAKLYHT